MPNGSFDGVRFGDIGVTILAIYPRSRGKTVIQVAVRNFQETAITVDRTLFKLADADGNLYDPSDVPGGIEDNMFQRQVNPGVTIVGWLAFETPPSLDVPRTLLNWRESATGKSTSQQMLVLKKETPIADSNTPGITPPVLFYAPDPVFTDEGAS